jgi:hypothetical protein
MRQPGKVGACRITSASRGVAVEAEGVLDVAVVLGVGGRGEQCAVEPQAAGLVVDLVLVPGTLRDLHQNVELQHGRNLSLTVVGVSLAHNIADR